MSWPQEGRAGRAGGWELGLGRVEPAALLTQWWLPRSSGCASGCVCLSFRACRTCASSRRPSGCFPWPPLSRCPVLGREEGVAVELYGRRMDDWGGSPARARLVPRPGALPSGERLPGDSRWHGLGPHGGRCGESLRCPGPWEPPVELYFLGRLGLFPPWLRFTAVVSGGKWGASSGRRGFWACSAALRWTRSQSCRAGLGQACCRADALKPRPAPPSLCHGLQVG